MTQKIAACILLHAAAQRDWTMTVTCEGEVDYRGKSATQAWAAVVATTEASVIFSDATGKRLGSAYLMAPGALTCDPDETIVDHSAEGPVAALCDDALEAAQP